jgi:hypothetical protein
MSHRYFGERKWSTLMHNRSVPRVGEKTGAIRLYDQQLKAFQVDMSENGTDFIERIRDV